ncbi:unnamed protein product [Somion occarium]|uniref:Uncharacterized protein n=1 Tax=Somion occarium TaxID=3059160 RepID=A0ABP1DQN7_9APHY
MSCVLYTRCCTFCLEATKHLGSSCMAHLQYPVQRLYSTDSPFHHFPLPDRRWVGYLSSWVVMPLHSSPWDSLVSPLHRCAAILVSAPLVTEGVSFSRFSPGSSSPPFSRLSIPATCDLPMSALNLNLFTHLDRFILSSTHWQSFQFLCFKLPPRATLLDNTIWTFGGACVRVV